MATLNGQSWRILRLALLFYASLFELETWKAAGFFIVRYSLDMTVKEFEILWAMKSVLNISDLLRLALVTTLLSIPSTAFMILVAYNKYLQQWALMIVIAAVNSRVVYPLANHWIQTYWTKTNNKMYGSIIDTYSMVSHSTDKVTLPEYIEVVSSCVFPVLSNVRMFLDTASGFVLSVFSIFYMLYLLRPNPYHVAVVILSSIVIRRMLKTQKLVDDRWHDYIRESDHFYSIKDCLDKMMFHSEVPSGIRREWCFFHSKQWEKIWIVGDRNNIATSIFVFFSVNLLYLCSKGPYVALGWREDENEDLSLALVYSTLPDVLSIMHFVRELISSKSKNSCESAVFPRVHSVVTKHSSKELESFPVEYPLVLDFPYRVTSTGGTVTLVRVEGSRHDPSTCESTGRLQILRGDRVLVWGTSGCGKSSLLQEVFRMNTIDSSSKTHNAYVQWISEGVAPTIDFKYLTMESMFDFTVTEMSDSTSRTALDEERRHFLKCFDLTSLHERCREARKDSQKKQSDANNTTEKTVDFDFDIGYLTNVSAGEKNRLHSMACLWKAIHDEQISTIVWDEGDQGISDEMFVSTLQSIDRLTKEKTLICISHCSHARDMNMWDSMVEFGKE